MRVKCLACGGTYATTDRQGLPYYHACPPLVLVTVERAGVQSEVPATQVKPGEKQLSVRELARENARNENVHTFGPRQGQMLAEGAGVEVLNGAPKEPARASVKKGARKK